MHIRENDASNSFLSAETFLQFKVKQGEQVFEFDEPVLFSSLGNNTWKESYLVGKDLLEVGVKEFIPNPKQLLEEDAQGKPTVKVVFAGMNGREEYYVSAGETKSVPQCAVQLHGCRDARCGEHRLPERFATDEERTRRSCRP